MLKQGLHLCVPAMTPPAHLKSQDVCSWPVLSMLQQRLHKLAGLYQGFLCGSQLDPVRVRILLPAVPTGSLMLPELPAWAVHATARDDEPLTEHCLKAALGCQHEHR